MLRKHLKILMQQTVYDMALRSKSYKSISRPSLSSGSSKGFSSYAASLAKKQQAAEDAIIDNQYGAGEISAETYLSHINTRLTRPDLTPLQMVNLREKATNVAEKVQDAMVDTQYSQGKLKTTDVLAYERTKLERMPEQESAAYQEQLKKVQQLTDKAEREARTAYRVAESLRISKLPEDSSAILHQKAQLYERLENQARLDGDAQAADTFATSKNNYLDAAKRADVNDLITTTRQSVSQTLPGGLGVPSALSGEDYYRSLVGGAPPSGGGSGGSISPTSTANVSGAGGGGAKTPSNSVTSTYSGGGNTAAIRNAFESLDASQKTLDRLAASRKDKMEMIASYDRAIAQASGDQKTTLTIARNNIASSIAEIDNSTDREYSNIQDKVVRIQEMQQKAAYSAFKTNVSKEKQALALEESKLEQDLKAGRITKEKYLFEAANLTGARIQLHTDEANGYRQFGEDDRADTVDDTVSQLRQTRPAVIYQSLIEGTNTLPDLNKKNEFIKKTIDTVGQSFELIRNTQDGALNNISGKALKKGDIALQDVSEEKLRGTFTQDYVKDGNVYSKIVYPTMDDLLTGQKVSNKKVKEIANSKGNQPFYIGADGQAKPVKFVNVGKPGETKYVPYTEENLKKNAKLFTPDPAGNGMIYNYKPAVAPKAKGLVEQAKENWETADTNFKNTMGKVNSTIGKAVANATNFIHNALPNFSRATPPGTNAPQSTPQSRGFSNPFKLTVNAGETTRTPLPIGRTNNQVTPTPTITGVPPELIKSLTDELKAKKAYSPENLAYLLATIQHETAGTFKPVNEGYYLDKPGQEGAAGRRIALQNGYSGGENYYGRGYIQLTHDYNYRDMGKKIGVDLEKNPELANDPKVAAKIAVQFAKDRGVLDLASQGKFVEARRPVNPDNKGYDIAQKAVSFLNTIKSASPVKAAQAATVKPPLVPGARQSPTPTQAPKAPNPVTKVIQNVAQNFSKATQANNVMSPVPAGYSPTPRPTSTPTPAKPQISSPIPNYTPTVQGVKAPQIQLPKITMPSIPAYKPPAVVQNVVKAATPVVNNVVKSVQQAAQNVGNFLSNLNPFKKKK